MTLDRARKTLRLVNVARAPRNPRLENAAFVPRSIPDPGGARLVMAKPIG